MSAPKEATLSYEFRQRRARRTAAVAVEPPASVPDDEAPTSPPPARLPRVTRLLALAHRFADLLGRGEVVSMAELARAGRVTRARLSQIMDLTLLAPDIQEQILHLEGVAQGCDPITMREMREVAGECYWPRQREKWRKLRMFRDLDRASRRPTATPEGGPASTRPQ
jgi:hypothetical protein